MNSLISENLTREERKTIIDAAGKNLWFFFAVIYRIKIENRAVTLSD
jgi:hypothetical protein